MSDLVIHFKKPDNWNDNLFIHFWDANPGGSGTDWPGEPMEKGEDGWHTFTFVDASAVHFVCNDGNSRQTQDLWTDLGGWFQADGQWAGVRPD